LTLRTTIVATLGPATATPEAIEALITAGMKVARINFSHGTHAEHRERIEAVRAIAAQLGKPVACLQDLCGPKIRTGTFQHRKAFYWKMVRLAFLPVDPSPAPFRGRP